MAPMAGRAWASMLHEPPRAAVACELQPGGAPAMSRYGAAPGRLTWRVQQMDCGRAAGSMTYFVFTHL